MATDVKISIIVPLYNAERTLRRCVDSILAQTFTDYELLLVNDGSTDGSAAICADYASKHPHVRVLDKTNGGVSSARNAGIRAAQGDYLAFVDADDEIKPSFLATFAEQGMAHDLCIQSMTLVNTQGERQEVCLAEQLLTKKDDMAAAILDILWKQLPVSACYSLFQRRLIMEHGMEFDERIVQCEDTDFMLHYLLHCETMHILPTPNYIYYLPASNKNYKNTEGLYLCLRLLDTIYALTNSPALRQAFRSRYYLCWATEELFYYRGDDLHELAAQYGRLCQPYLKEDHRPALRHRLFKYICLSKKPNAIIRTAKLVMSIHRFSDRVMSRLMANRYYNWYVFSQKLSTTLRQQIEPHYTSDDETPAKAPHPEQKTVVAVHNGWTESGGWADRLRGIVSVYTLCQEEGLNFRIHFTHPFPLDMFLVPNTYDWRMPAAEMTFKRPAATPVCLEVGNESRWQANKQKDFLRRHIKEAPGPQIHIYTNALFAYYEGFSKPFHELFRPSPRLQAAIDRESTRLGGEYVSVSARFLGALGDFKDTVASEELPADQKAALITACLVQVEAIHAQHPDMAVLVNSDSTTFLGQASRLPYTCTIPGHITHLDTTDGQTDDEAIYQTFEKTLLDFFMIAQATHIYRLDGCRLRPSGFPYAASLVHSHPFHSLQIHM